jgi:NTE family protein
MTNSKERASIQIGLALSGGGARGLAHIGVLRVLEELQIPVSILAGTSMGGIVSALYDAGRSLDEIEELFRSLRPLDIIQRARTGLGLLGQDKIANWLREALGGDLTFDQLRLPLALIATDLETGDEIVIRDGSVVEGLLATMALPIIFSPPRWRDHWLVDGAVVNPVPFDVARQMGADRVIAVHTRQVFPPLLEDDPAPHGREGESIVRLLLPRSRRASLLHVGERSLDIAGRELVEQRMRAAPPDLMIEALLDDVGLVDFDQIDDCLAIGEQAARQHTSELIELRDTPLPSRWALWWRGLQRRLTELGIWPLRARQDVS